MAWAVVVVLLAGRALLEVEGGVEVVREREVDEDEDVLETVEERLESEEGELELDDEVDKVDNVLGTVDEELEVEEDELEMLEMEDKLETEDAVEDELELKDVLE